METSWLALMPPLLVIFVAFTTRRMQVSLFLGILASLILVHKGFTVAIIYDFCSRLLATTELQSISSLETLWGASNLCILLFLLVVGVFIALLRISGGAYAYGESVARYLKNKRDAHMALLLFSLCFFIDDYLSSISVGSVMQSVTDRFTIPRIKLAFLVNCMAAPLVVIVPVSSWVANITTQLKNTGVSLQADALIKIDPFYLYIKTIPYLLYSFLTIVLVWFIVIRSLSFGILRKHEKIALKTGNLFAGKTAVMEQCQKRETEEVSLIDFIVPLTTLFVFVAISMLYFGNWIIFGGTKSLFDALSSTRIAPVLLVASTNTVLISIGFLLLRNRIMWRDVAAIIVSGVQLMYSSVCMLTLAWTLSTLLGSDLATGSYLASLVTGKINAWLLPIVFFLLTAATTTLMGSAWGAMSIHIPIAVPMLISVGGNTEVISLLLPLLGAIISGAVVGNHLSPMADNTLMAATSSGAYVIDVFKAQVSFTLPVAIFTAAAFALLGYVITIGLSPLYALLISFLSACIIGMIYFFMIHHFNK